MSTFVKRLEFKKHGKLRSDLRQGAQNCDHFEL